MHACTSIAFAASVAALFACSFDGSGNGNGGPDVDASSPQCTIWGARRFFRPCDHEQTLVTRQGLPPLAAATDYLLDTTDGELLNTQTNATMMVGTVSTLTDELGRERSVLLIVGDQITIPATVTVRAIGPRPLAILATSEIVVEGTLDVASGFSGDLASVGAGAGSDECFAATPGGPSIAGAGGGGGGGYGSSGGNGGTGTDGTPGQGGPASDSAQMASLRGGCRGAAGGIGESTVPLPAAGGSGGGAILLASLTVIDIRPGAKVLAGGMGGAVPTIPRRGGGGGGGSGGLIALDAFMINLGEDAVVVANGGGGGGGIDGKVSDGMRGSDGLGDSVAAPGGLGKSTIGGDGGFAEARPGGLGGDSDKGASGGGGGVGFVISIAETTNDFGPIISPRLNSSEPTQNR